MSSKPRTDGSGRTVVFPLKDLNNPGFATINDHGDHWIIRPANADEVEDWVDNFDSPWTKLLEDIGRPIKL